MTKRLLLAALLACGLSTAAFAQNTVGLCYWGLVNGINKCTQVSSTNPLPTTGSGGGGASAIDEAAFTYGSSSYTPTGGVYNSSITNLTSGQGGAVALTAARSMHVLDDNSAALLSAVQGAIPAGTNAIGSILPNAATSTQTKVTITTGSTYQQYLASNASRKGCTIQFITAAHTGYVFFGSAPADTTTSFQLSPGQSLSCQTGTTVLTDAIQLTSSNNSDVFVVNSW